MGNLTGYCVLQGVVVTPGAPNPEVDFYLYPFARLYEPQVNIDYPNNDLEILDASVSSTECARRCDESPLCVGFRAPLNKSGCSLKRYLSGSVNDTSLLLTTFVIPGTHVYNYISGNGSTYSANSYDLASFPFDNNCLGHCVSTPGCVAFVTPTLGSTGNCTLKGALIGDPIPAVDVVLYSDATTNSYTQFSGFFFQGEVLKDLGSLFPSNECAQQCDELSGCLAFSTSNNYTVVYNSTLNISTTTVIPTGYGCVLLGTVFNGTDDLSLDTYIAAGHVPYEMLPSIDYPGNDIAIFSNVSHRECAHLCDAEYRCVGYNYNVTKGCALKSSLTLPVHDSSLDFYRSLTASLHNFEYYPSSTVVYFAEDIPVGIVYNTSSDCAEICDSLTGA